MKQQYKKKLIEVAMPLNSINKACDYEKKPGIGPHPRGIHHWWARRPHTAARAFLFAQLIDDPISRPEDFKTEEDQKQERKRLMSIIEKLSEWKSNNNDKFFFEIRSELKKSIGNDFPIILDPFSGGCTIPLEGKRMGLEVHGSDLSAVSTILGKSMIEINELFQNMPPLNPNGNLKNHYRGFEGLAEDFKYYGFEVIKNCKQKLKSNYETENIKDNRYKNSDIVAWIWTNTVASPDPSLNGLHVPLVKSFDLVTSRGNRVWIKPLVQGDRYSFRVLSELDGCKYEKIEGTIGRHGGRCIVSGSAITLDYIRNEGKKGLLSQKLMAVCVKGKGRKNYFSPPLNYEKNIFLNSKIEYINCPIEHWPGSTNCVVYGRTKFQDLFSSRQLNSLIQFSLEIKKIEKQIFNEIKNKLELYTKEKKINLDLVSKEYLKLIMTFLAFTLSRALDFNNMHCRWSASNEKIMQLFARGAIPMCWDFGEANLFEDVVGGFPKIIDYQAKCIETLFVNNGKGRIIQSDAREAVIPKNSILNTDPPYYDNIPYSNLADFFHVWLKKTIGHLYPDELSTLSSPKETELVANQFRFGGKELADKTFLDGMTFVINRYTNFCNKDYPLVIYYAFKQSEIENHGIFSPGWDSFLTALISTGLQVVQTWPARTESSTRIRALGYNALATSVIVVCRKRDNVTKTISKHEFIRQLKTELPRAISDLKAANISPADIPQSSIGPGIGIFSRYQAVLENDDSHMSVKTALQLINRELGDEEGEYDSETSFAITWFEQNGFNVGDFGSANNIANAKGISVNTLVHSGVAQSSGGKFSLLDRESLEDDWDPTTDKNLTIWECCQYLIKTMENKGEFETAKLIKQMGSRRADSAKELAYTLYDIAANKRKDANEATAYNGLIAVWSELTAQSVNITEGDLRGDAQMKMI